MAKKHLIVGNLKMYLQKTDEAKCLAQGLRRRARTYQGAEAWLAPAYPHLPAVALALKGSNIKVGAQGASAYDGGAHTGEVSAEMLKASGAYFSIVGHSEQRAVGTSDELVHAQLVRALNAGLMAILCVGERERDQSGSHFAFVEAQLRSAFAGAQSYANKVVVAYEPVWAIGKAAADAMQPAQVQEMVIFIRKVLADLLGRTAALRVVVLYGGSVEPDNATALITEGGVGGFLVGHASSELGSFIEILQAVRPQTKHAKR